MEVYVHCSHILVEGVSSTDLDDGCMRELGGISADPGEGSRLILRNVGGSVRC